MSRGSWRTRNGSRPRAACSRRRRGEALDRLAALSARLLGAAHAQVSIVHRRAGRADAASPRASRPRTRCCVADRSPRRPLALADAAGAGHRAPTSACRSRPRARASASLCVYDERAVRVDRARHRGAARARRDGRGRARARRARRRAGVQHGAARPRVRGRQHRQLRLEPGHQRAALGRPADGALRLRRPRPTCRTSTRSRSRLHPDDRERVEAAIARAIDRCGDYEADYRVVHPDGAVRWVAARGRVLCGHDGTPGADARRRLRHDRRPQRRRAPRPGARDDEHGVLHARPRLALHLRQRRGRADPRPPPRRARRPRASGRSTPTSTAPRATSTTGARWRPASRSSFEQYYPPLDTWFDVRATPSDDGLSVYFHDITDRVRAEQDARGRRSPRPARRPAACRSSAPPAPGWRGRSRSTSCCGSSPTSSSTASARAWWSRSTSGSCDEIARHGRSDRVRRASGATRRRRAAARLAADRGRPLRRAQRRVRELIAARSPSALGERPALALPLVSRGRMLGAVVVLDAGRRRARPARAGRARRARRGRARQRACSSAPSGGSR